MEIELFFFWEEAFRPSEFLMKKEIKVTKMDVVSMYVRIT